jgi:hypothetical protein
MTPASVSAPRVRGHWASTTDEIRPPAQRELPDVTGFLVVVIVTLGLFVVPVGATIMQGPAIVASLIGR